MNEIFEFLLSLDCQIFLFINNGLANPVFDFLMPFITNKKNWLIPIGLTWLLLIWKGGKRGRIVAFLIIPILILADQTSSSLLKHAFDRLRPCKALDNVRLLIPCGSGYSFPSSHATNISAAFTPFIYYYRKYATLWIIIILLIGFSRIYVGVHYPLDVIGGFVVGTTISILLIFLFGIVERRLNPSPESRDK
jgi:undecaprenyl-diphosphatase